MAEKLTFKEYVESKERLREAVKNTPQQEVQYTVRKYCKLVVGESKDEKEQINLKPNQTITVSWLYENFDNPTPLSITFNGVKSVDSEQVFSTSWAGFRLERWLMRNAREEN